MKFFLMNIIVILLLSGTSLINGDDLNIKMNQKFKEKKSVFKNTSLFLYQDSGQHQYFFYEGEKEIDFKIKKNKLYINSVLRGIKVNSCEDLKLVSETVDNISFSTVKSLNCIQTLSNKIKKSSYINIYPEDQDEHITTAMLTVKQMKALVKIKNIKALTLSRVKTDDLKYLGNMKKLKYLNLNVYKKKTHFLKKLKNLESLRLQFISNNDLKNIMNLKKLKNLELFSYITADYPTNKINDKGLKYLRNLKNLEYLNLIYNKIKGWGLIYLKNLKNLRHLNLSYCSWLKEKKLYFLRKLKNLEVLKLNAMNLKGSGLSYFLKLKKLKKLTLMASGIQDRYLKYVASMKSLIYVDLMDTEITEKGFALLKKQRPNLEIFWENKK